MSDGMGRELAYLSSHATNRYFIPNWGKLSQARALPFRKKVYLCRKLLKVWQRYK